MSRRKVAVFTASIYQDMSKETQYGIIQAARRNDIKLTFFTSFSDNFSRQQFERYRNYDSGDFAVFSLPDLSSYDGLISLDTYMPDLYIEPLNELKAKAQCPVVTLGEERDFTYNVINDQDRSLMELIEHLIIDHGCKDIYHVSGKPELEFSQKRIEIFKETLAKHNLPNGDDKIVTGDLWYDCGDRVVDEILKAYSNNASKLLPDAIVCANDYSALGVIKALKKRGYRIPEDVLVTGYDNVYQSMYNNPSLTTSAQPFSQVGNDGINILVNLWNGKEVERTTKEPGILMKRQSCGCTPTKLYKQDSLRDEFEARILRLGDLAQTNTNLIMGVNSSETAFELFNEIEQNCLRNTGFSNAVLCLMKGWENHVVVTDRDQIKDEKFEVVCGMYNNKPIRRQWMKAGQLLPEEMENDPEPYFIFPIHNLQYFMGYFIVSPDLEKLNQLNIKSWLVNISSMLENWRIKQELKVSVERLRNLYITDMLTGLYNRRGFNLYFNDFYDECISSKTELVTFLVDMDNLKITNDNYGHDEGDYCLCTIANALQNSTTGDEICVRTGGDEFVVLAKNYTDERIKEYIKNVKDNIEKKRTDDKKEFSIDVSIGYYANIPQEDDKRSINDISEEYLRFADREMYKEKKAHKQAKKEKH